MNYTAVIVAAGRGSRSGLSYNKVLYPFQGRPILAFSLDRFEKDPDCTQIVVVCADSERAAFEAQFGSEKAEFCTGGSTRQESVLFGLKRTRESSVLIHDGARPFVSARLVDRIKQALETHPAVVPGVEVVDTVKEVDEDGFCIRTPVRSSLRAVQTPQAFSTCLVRNALEWAAENGVSVTDDAMAVELFDGTRSLCVPGERSNLKITSPEDLERISTGNRSEASDSKTA